MYLYYKHYEKITYIIFWASNIERFYEFPWKSSIKYSYQYQNVKGAFENIFYLIDFTDFNVS